MTGNLFKVLDFLITILIIINLLDLFITLYEAPIWAFYLIFVVHIFKTNCDYIYSSKKKGVYIDNAP